MYCSPFTNPGEFAALYHLIFNCFTEMPRGITEDLLVGKVYSAQYKTSRHLGGELCQCFGQQLV